MSLCHQVVELGFDSCDNASNDRKTELPHNPVVGPFRGPVPSMLDLVE